MRRNQDPTNALRFRLREAEKESFRLATWQVMRPPSLAHDPGELSNGDSCAFVSTQNKIREAVKVNVPFSLMLLVLSAYAFATDDATERHFLPVSSSPTSTTTRSAPVVNPVKTVGVGVHVYESSARTNSKSCVRSGSSCSYKTCCWLSLSRS